MGEILYRTVPLGLETRGGKDDVVTATLSTEQPCEMNYGLEVLKHELGAVNLSRAKNGLPLLWQHNSNEIVGRVENIRIEDHKLKGDLRAGNSQKAKELWADVRAGIVKDLSIGYTINEKPVLKDGVFVVPKWTIYEASLVSIGADVSAGIGRNLHQKNSGGRIMIEKNEQSEETWKKDKFEERQRACELLALGEQFDCLPLAKRAVESGMSLDAFKEQILATKYRTPRPIDTNIGMSERETNQFSFTRALRAMMTGNRNEASFEYEASRAVEQRIGRKAQGIFVPGEVLSTRALTKGVGADGGYTVATELLAENFIDRLRNQTHVITLGATILSGLKGDVAIPKLTGSGTAYWISEGTDVTASQQTFGQVVLSPKTLAGRTQFTRKLLLQATPDIEQIVRGDLSKTLAVELDRAAINGSGAANQPMGILNTTGVGLVEIGANGGVPTWGHIVQLIGEIEQDNVIGTGFLTNSKIKAKLANTFTNSTYGEIPIWGYGVDGEGRLAGYKAFTSSNVPSNLTKGTGTNLSAIIFGNWSDLFIGQWGVLDLLLDPYTLAASGGMQVTAMFDVDVAIRHPESFAVIKDAITT